MGMLPDFLNQVFQGVIHHRIIAIHKGDIFSPCLSDSGIAGIAQASVCLVNHPDAGIFPGIFIAELGTAVV